MEQGRALRLAARPPVDDQAAEKIVSRGNLAAPDPVPDVARSVHHPGAWSPPAPRDAYMAAVRTLVVGFGWTNLSGVARDTGLSHVTLGKFLRGGNLQADTLDAIAWVLWRKLNAHHLVTADDLAPPAAAADRDRV